MNCPDGYHEVIGRSLLGNVTITCEPDDNTQAILDAESEVANAKKRMDDAFRIYQQQKKSTDIFQYPTQTEVPGPPLNVPSRANQKANLFNKAFNPANRKIIVLLIAGFLLFLAITNYE